MKELTELFYGIATVGIIIMLFVGYVVWHEEGKKNKKGK